MPHLSLLGPSSVPLLSPAHPRFALHACSRYGWRCQPRGDDSEAANSPNCGPDGAQRGTHRCSAGDVGHGSTHFRALHNETLSGVAVRLRHTCTSS